MYTGHAAIAMFVKGKRPRLPLALLVPVAFGPDWVDMFSHVIHHPNPDVSHSLLSVGICSVVVGLCAIPFFGGVDGAIVGATYASHWVADSVTGLKPTWPGGPSLGAQLYTHRLRDFAFESLVVVACWLVYRASLRDEVRNAIAAYALPLGLIALQAAFAFVHAPTLS
jgi:hypothetical protein